MGGIDPAPSARVMVPTVKALVAIVSRLGVGTML